MRAPYTVLEDGDERLLAGIGVLMGAAVLLYIGSQGISAKADPGRFETFPCWC
jgi:hypothetical protein